MTTLAFGTEGRSRGTRSIPYAIESGRPPWVRHPPEGAVLTAPCRSQLIIMPWSGSIHFGYFPVLSRSRRMALIDFC